MGQLTLLDQEKQNAIDKVLVVFPLRRVICELTATDERNLSTQERNDHAFRWAIHVGEEGSGYGETPGLAAEHLLAVEFED